VVEVANNVYATWKEPGGSFAGGTRGKKRTKKQSSGQGRGFFNGTKKKEGPRGKKGRGGKLHQSWRTRNTQVSPIGGEGKGNGKLEEGRNGDPQRGKTVIPFPFKQNTFPFTGENPGGDSKERNRFIP